MGSIRPLIGLIAGNTISDFGNLITSIAVTWFVLQTTGSAAQAGLSGTFALLPLAIAGILGGPVVDRLGFKRSSLLSDLLSGATVALIPLLYALGRLQFWHILVLVFAGTLLDIPGGTARRSMLPDLAEAGKIELERANVFLDTLRRLSQFIGPPVAGVLIALLGATGTLWLNAGLFVVSAALIGWAVPVVRREPRQHRPYLQDLLQGWRFLRTDRVVTSLIMVISIMNTLINPIFLILLPVLVQRRSDSAAELGVLIGSFGLGTVAGGLLFGWRGPKLRRVSLFRLCLALIGLSLLLLVWDPAPLLLAAGLLLMGLGIGPLGPLVMTVLGERTPPEMRGRVFGTFNTLANMAIPLGVGAAGFLVEPVGIRRLIVAIALAYGAVALGALFLHPLRQIERPAA